MLGATVLVTGTVGNGEISEIWKKIEIICTFFPLNSDSVCAGSIF